MKKEIKISFDKHKWWFDLMILRLHWKSKGKCSQIDVLFKLGFGYGLLGSSLKRGIFFFTDLLQFNVEEADYKAKGFSIPLGRSAI